MVQFSLGEEKKLIPKVKALLDNPLVIMGRIYRPFCHRDGALVFFAESGPGIETIPLARFLETHIQAGLNEGMSIPKYISRFELGLSTTVCPLHFSTASH